MLDTRRPPTAAAVVLGSSPGCDFPLLPPASREVELDQMCQINEEEPDRDAATAAAIVHAAK